MCGSRIQQPAYTRACISRFIEIQPVDCSASWSNACEAVGPSDQDAGQDGQQYERGEGEGRCAR